MFASLSELFRRRFERISTRNLRLYPARYHSRFCNIRPHLRWHLEQSTPTGIMFRAGLLFLLFLFAFSSALTQGNDSDYSKFLHTSSKHASIDCANCHHRNDNSARPSFPGHKDCTSCHLTQFTTPNIPLCAICHT